MSDCSESAILVIAKSDEDKIVSHFLAFTNDEGEAIKMAKNHIWPELADVQSGVMLSGGSGRRYNQFTVKRVWSCEPIPGKKLFIL